MERPCFSRHAVSELPQAVATVIILEPSDNHEDVPSPTLCDPNIKTITAVPDITIDPVEVSLKTIGRWASHTLPGCAITEDVAGSFQDGTLLCELLAKLTGDSVIVHPRADEPLSETAALENLCAAFKQLRELGVDTRRCSFTDFSDGDVPRMATMLYRVVLWAEFDSSKWTGVERNPTQVVGGFEQDCEQHMISWVQSILADSCVLDSPLGFADGEALCLLVALQHYFRFSGLGVQATTFEQFFSTTKQSDYFRTEDASAAEKCGRALKVGDNCLGIPMLLDADEVGREPASLCIYLMLARKCIERYEAKIADRAAAKSHWAQVDEQDAEEARLAAELASQEAELARVQEMQARAEQAVLRAEQLEAEQQAQFQAVRDELEAVERAKYEAKAALEREVDDTAAKHAEQVKELAKTLQAGLVSLGGKAKAESENLVMDAKTQTLKHLSEMKQRVERSKAKLASDAKSYTEVRKYDQENVVSSEVLSDQLLQYQKLSLEATHQAEQAAQRVDQVNKWAVHSQDARVFHKAELARQFEADQLLLSEEVALTQLAVCRSPEQQRGELSDQLQLQLEAEANHRAEFNAGQDRAMQEHSEMLARVVAEAAETEYREAQVARAKALKAEDSALSVQRSVPHPLKPYLDDGHPLQALLAETAE